MWPKETGRTCTPARNGGPLLSAQPRARQATRSRDAHPSFLQGDKGRWGGLAREPERNVQDHASRVSEGPRSRTCRCSPYPSLRSQPSAQSHVTHYNSQLEMGATCCPVAETVTSAGEQRRQRRGWHQTRQRPPARACRASLRRGETGSSWETRPLIASITKHQPSRWQSSASTHSPRGWREQGQPPGILVAITNPCVPVHRALRALRGKAGGQTTARGR